MNPIDSCSLLHIITPLYRFEYLDAIYASIPAYVDITWHLSLSNRRNLPENQFISNDKRVKIHYLDCEDDDLVMKRNGVFKSIRSGYFYLLDDDTIFLEEVYHLYKKYSLIQFQGLILGRQYRPFYDASPLRPYGNPLFNNIDTGMAIAHCSVLKAVSWEWCESKYSRDCYFWSKCYEYFGEKLTINSKQYISIYNKLNPTRPLLVIKKEVGFIQIDIKISHQLLGKMVVILLLVRNFPRRVLNIK
ncbi:hypothetical protein [Aquirufa salirivi]|uniref:Glycosyltransferase family 2 protein n=1 Tax=Aquirufa salirivi TaxID=3104729 RepID=A0ABW8RZ33_9BACT